MDADFWQLEQFVRDGSREAEARQCSPEAGLSFPGSGAEGVVVAVRKADHQLCASTLMRQSRVMILKLQTQQRGAARAGTDFAAQVEDILYSVTVGTLV